MTNLNQSEISLPYPGLRHYAILDQKTNVAFERLAEKNASGRRRALKRVQVKVFVDDQIVSALDLICFEERKTRSQLIREILSNFLGTKR